MIKKALYYYYKTTYFAQKAAGWKDSKKGFKNYISMNGLFISSGIVISIFLPLLVMLSIEFMMIFYIIYAGVYYKFIIPYIEDKVETRINYELLDSQYEKTNVIKKILFVAISIIFLFCSILTMILSIYTFVKIWKLIEVI